MSQFFRFVFSSLTRLTKQFARLPHCIALGVMLVAASTGALAASGVVISQVYGGGGNSGATVRNDFIELFNASAAPVNLAGWSVQYASATGTSWQTTPLTNTVLAPGQYYLVQQAVGAGGTVNLPTPDAVGTIAMGATAGKVALVNSIVALTGANPTGAQIEDLLGYGSTANGAEGAPTANLSNTTAALRNANGCTDTNNNGLDFSISAPTPRNTNTALAPCGGVANQPIVPTCAATTVVAGTASSVAISATDSDSIVNAVTVVGTPPAGFALGALNVPLGDGGVATGSVSVASSVAPGSYALQLLWSNNDAQTATCTLNVTVSGITAIYTIQGGGTTSGLVGQTVTTRGIVTRLTNNGFFMQDVIGDGDAATSDGIFVFTSTTPTASIGQLIQLSGVVAEFNTGAASNAETAARPVTELINPSGLSVLSSGNALPAPVIITLPEAVNDALERYEGMLVTLTGPLTVSQNFFLGRYGQVTLSSGGRLETPTNRFRPGPSANALANENARRSILLDDGTTQQNPNPTPYVAADNTLRAGDSVDAITGVIDYGLATNSNTGPGDYKIQPTSPVSISRVNLRTTAPDPVAGNIRVAGANVLNFFTTFTDGNTASGQSGQGCALGGNTSPANCRGADNLAEFQRQRAKIVAMLRAINADVVGLIEIQNQDNIAVQNLVDALNAAVGAGTYATVPVPANGTGSDAIRVAMIFKPARVTLVGSAISDANPIHNRPPLAQTFAAANGERITVVVNHFKSKGSCPATASDPNADQGDGQGCWNALRVQQADQLRSFVTSLLSSSGTPNVLLLGDFNAYAQEDPVYNLVSNGFIDEIGRFNAFGYSYVFDGAAGRLDHAFASTSLSPKLTGATEWHINADEPSVIDYNLEFKQPACPSCGPDYYTPTPYRASDHDPVVVGLNLLKTIEGTAGRDTLVGSDGDDVIIGRDGSDTLTGNAGSDIFVYTSLRDANDMITDFLPATDRLDLRGLLASIGYTGANAIADGRIRVIDTANGASVQVDADGPAGATPFRPLVTLRGIAAAQIAPTRDLGL